MLLIIGFLFVAAYSTLLYAWLHKKTHISLKYLYKDNVADIALVCGLLLFARNNGMPPVWLGLCAAAGVPLACILLTLLRFYRVPLRKTMR